MPFSIPLTTLSHNLNKRWAAVETSNSAAINMNLWAETFHDVNTDSMKIQEIKP